MKLEYLAVKEYNLIRNKIKTGDSLLCSGDGLSSRIIQKFTKSEFSHIGIIVVVPILNIIMVAESIEGNGVRWYPLSKYLKLYDGKLAIFRHKTFSNEQLDKEGLVRLIFQRMGDKYDNGELGRIGWRSLLSLLKINLLLKLKFKVIKNSTFICSEFVAFIYVWRGINPPYNKNGYITPADFACWKELKFKWRIK